MRADRVILRSVLTTLLAIIVLFGAMLLVLCLVFPSTMMELTYDLGMDGASVKYAARAYRRTDDVYYAAFATETSILMDDMEKIEENGLTLIQDDEFADYCKIRYDVMAMNNEAVELSYEQYIY